MAFADEAIIYDLSGISGFGRDIPGILYNGTLYAGDGDNVSLNISRLGYTLSDAAATIPANCIAQVDYIGLGNYGSITIEDGGQLITNCAVEVTVKKEIDAYNPQNTGLGNTDGWYFIASPIMEAYTPAGSMIEGASTMPL